MSIIIRLQNLPWAADSGDIRRYFAGLSIPEGGVHIVGGEMGDAFIAFSTDEDARLAMEKDGGKIHEMQIKLLLSSRTEMMRVIEKARQQNLALQSQYTMPLSQPMVPMQQPVMQMQQPVMSAQQPIMSAQQPIMSAQQPIMSAQQPMISGQQPIIQGQQSMMSVPQTMMPAQQPIMPAQQPIISVQQPLVPSQHLSRMAGAPAGESDRKRGRSPSPSHRRGRDKSPPRDRRRSPDRRDRSKRDRSRSPARRGSRDVDRRGDRFKRDDRRFDEGLRYRDDRHSDRDDGKRQDADGLNRHSSDGYRQSSNHGYYGSSVPAVASSGYNYDSSQMRENSGSFYNFPANEKSNALPMDKQNSSASNAVSASSAQAYMQQPMSFTGMPYDQAPQVSKEAVSNPVNDPTRDKRRRSRFEGEYTSSQEPPFFPSPTQNQKAGENSPFGDKRGTVQDFRPTRDPTWPPREDQLENTQWPKKRSGLLEPPISKNGDSLQVVPMDLEQSPPRTPESKNPFGISDQYVTQIAPVFPTNDMPKKEEMARRGPNIRNDNQWREAPITVEVKGIPPDVRINEMRDLFPNISIPSANICIKANNQGAEKVFIRFNHPSECAEVLNRQPYYIRNYCCQVSPCPVDAFEAAVASSNSGKPHPKPAPREEDLFVQLKGLPFTCSEADIEQFFKGLRIVDMVIEGSPDGRCSGVGFVQFSSSSDFRVALSMNGNMIGHRYITISVASKEIADQARRSSVHLPKRAKSPPHRSPSGPPGNFNSSRSPRRPKGPIDVPPSNLGNGPPPPSHGRPTNFSVSVRGLPDHVTNGDIADFFRETGIGIRAFHIMLNTDKLPNGDAFIEVASKGEADAAVSLNGKMMRGKRVSVTHISFQRMSEILHGPPTALTPPPAPGPLLQTPPSLDRPRRPLIPHAPEEPFSDQPPDNPPIFDGPPNDHAPYDHSRGERSFPPRGNRGRPDFPRGGQSRPDFSRGGQPRPDFPRGGQPRPDFSHGERPRMDGPFRGGGRSRMERPGGPTHGRMRAPFPNRPPYGGPPASRGGIPPGFGAPGCVVAVNNLHFRASLEDVLDFFKDYKLTKDSIMRRFNENDQVTGEARVAFQTPREAQKAVRELNHKPIMGRSLSLALL